MFFFFYEIFQKALDILCVREICPTDFAAFMCSNVRKHYQYCSLEIWEVVIIIKGPAFLAAIGMWHNPVTQPARDERICQGGNRHAFISLSVFFFSFFSLSHERACFERPAVGEGGHLFAGHLNK